MSFRLAVVVFAFSFLIMIYVGFIRNGQEDIDSTTMLPFQVKGLTITPVRPLISPSPSPSPAPSLQNSKGISSLSLDQFRSQFTGYQIQQNRRGQVTELLALDQNRYSLEHTNEIHLSDTQEILAYSQRLLDSLSPLFLKDSESKLSVGDPKLARLGGSVRVDYQQMIEGVPISPLAQVSIQFNQKGELEKFSSSYFSQVQITNRRTLAQEDVFLGRALKAREILWAEKLEPIPQLRHAYEVMDHGIQEIYDAETGQLLIKRNKRVY